MRLSNKKVIVVAVLLLICVAFASLFYLNIYKNTNGVVRGKVSAVAEKPNVAEDGYRGITVRDSFGKKYAINATGYMNTPASPADFDQTCVDVSDVKVGDTVEFELPKAEGQPDVYEICYPKDKTGYYFKKL